MAKKKDNGNFVLSAMEQDLLSILLGQQQGVYGLEILKRMNTASKKFGRSEITIGSLYPTLKRMEEQGLITGRWGESIPGEESGGARRRYYSISADGETAL
ncbi:MAG: PadR family transcriptional regulator, partial [Nostoc sp.]